MLAGSWHLTFRQCLHTASSCTLGFSQHSSGFQRKKNPELWRKRQSEFNNLCVPASKVTWILLCYLKQLHRSTQVQGGEMIPTLRGGLLRQQGRKGMQDRMKVSVASLGNSPNGLHVPCIIFSFALIEHCHCQRCLPYDPLFCLILSEFREHYRLQ